MSNYERMSKHTVFGYMTTDNKIGPEGAKALSDMLHTNTTLTKLNLCCKKKEHVHIMKHVE